MLSKPAREFTFVIEGEPIAQKRHRLGRYGNMYDPSSADKGIVRKIIATKVAKQDIFNPPIRVDITAFFQIPKSFSKKKQYRMCGQYHTKKPDKDNIEKFYLDVMKDIFYTDDSHIAVGRTIKLYSEIPRVEITIKEL